MELQRRCNTLIMLIEKVQFTSFINGVILDSLLPLLAVVAVMRHI